VDGELDSRGLMGDPSVRPYFQTINIEAIVKTTESEERVQELKEKTDARCPVFNTLKAPMFRLPQVGRKGNFLSKGNNSSFKSKFKTESDR
jgi:hypothetical protein